MGKPEIKFGDKLFLYGQYLEYLEEFGEREYNTVMGYMTVGGYDVVPLETDLFAASIPGFVVDFLYDGSLARATPFVFGEMVDVSDKLSKQTPSPFGTTVWMPITT